MQYGHRELEKAASEPLLEQPAGSKKSAKGKKKKDKEKKLDDLKQELEMVQTKIIKYIRQQQCHQPQQQQKQIFLFGGDISEKNAMQSSVERNQG